MLPGLQQGPRDAYHGHTRRRFGATDAIATSRGDDGRSAARPRLIARATAAIRGGSAGGEAAPGLECRQRTRLRWGLQTFFSRLDRDCPRPHAGQEGPRPHRERDMPIPADPAPHFIVVQAHFALGLLNAALDGPSAAGYPDDLRQGRDLRGKDHVGGQVRGIAQTPPDQQPAAPSGLQRWGQGQPAPVVPAGALSPVACTEAGPAVLRRGGQEAFDLPLLPPQPDLCLARHRQGIGRGLAFQPPAPPLIIPRHAVACHLRGRHAGRDGTGPQLTGQRRLGGNGPIRRDSRLLAARSVVRPLLGQIQFTIQQRMAQRTGIAHKHADLAVLHVADRPSLLAGDPSRVAPFFHKACFVEDQYTLRIAQMLDDIGAPLIAHHVSVPVGAGQQVLEAIRGGLATGFRHLPAVLAFRLPQQAAHIRHDPLARLRADDIPGQPPGNICHVGRATCHTAVGPGW